MFGKMKIYKRQLRIFAVVVLLMILTIFLYKIKNGDSTVKAPNWYGITPGLSTKEDVRSILGEPDKKRSNFFQLSTTYYFAETSKYIKNDQEFSRIVYHRITFQFGKVKYIIRNLYSGSGEEKYIRPEDIFNTFGAPEEVLYSKLEPPMWALLYCRQGIIAHGNTNHFSYIYYFEPMSQSKCIRQFKSVVSETNPYEGTDIIMMKDPWHFSD